jgi:hypothetical protein
MSSATPISPMSMKAPEAQLDPPTRTTASSPTRHQNLHWTLVRTAYMTRARARALQQYANLFLEACPLHVAKDNGIQWMATFFAQV